MNKELYKYAQDFVKMMNGYDWSYEGVDNMLNDYWPAHWPAQYKIAYGATRVAIIPRRDSQYVLKFNFDYVWSGGKAENGPAMDYNATEREIYDSAVDRGIGCLFAKTMEGESVLERPCILQERVCKVGTASDYYTSQKAWETLGRHNISRNSYEDLGISMELAGAIVECYGEDVFYRFCDFCEDHRINDIHNDNWGYIDGAPVVLDYAGYHENSCSSDDDSYYSADVGSGDGSWNSWGCSPSYSGSTSAFSDEK